MSPELRSVSPRRNRPRTKQYRALGRQGFMLCHRFPLLRRLQLDRVPKTVSVPDNPPVGVPVKRVLWLSLVPATRVVALAVTWKWIHAVTAAVAPAISLAALDL